MTGTDETPRNDVAVTCHKNNVVQSQEVSTLDTLLAIQHAVQWPYGIGKPPD